MRYPTFSRTPQIGGPSVFCRDPGPAGDILLLLRGLPSSSCIFETPCSYLSDYFTLVAPDYPGYEYSDSADAKQFGHTFENFAEVVIRFTQTLARDRCTLFIQDSGDNRKSPQAFWDDRAADESGLRTDLLPSAATRTRHLENYPTVERYHPDEAGFLRQPEQAEIQSNLFYDCRANIASYPKRQASMHGRQPQLPVIWGVHDLSYELSEPEAHHREVPSAQVNIPDAGHFALDTAVAAALVGRAE